MRRHSFGGSLRYDRANPRGCGGICRGAGCGVTAVYAVAGVVRAVRGEGSSGADGSSVFTAAVEELASACAPCGKGDVLVGLSSPGRSSRTPEAKSWYSRRLSGV